MKTQTITYTYDPDTRDLKVISGGKPIGGFVGPAAEKRFLTLLDTDVQINITAMTAEALKKILIRNFHAVLAKANLMSQKEAILSGYEVQSTTELTIDQLKEVIAKYGTEPRHVADRDDPAVRAMRSDLLTICNKMNIYVTNNDWGAVNAFFSDPRIAGKPMNRLSLEELKAIMPKMRAILAKHIKAQAELTRKQQLN